MATLDLSEKTTLPSDRYAGALAARVWRPDVDGPSVAAVREDGVCFRVDALRQVSTCSSRRSETLRLFPLTC